MVLLVSSAALWWAKREPDPLRLGDRGTVTAVAQEDCQSLSMEDFRRLALPWEAAFLAAKVYLAYRRSGGTRTSALPDFFIGAHAAVESLPILTRDPRRYRTYFPTLTVHAPD